MPCTQRKIERASHLPGPRVISDIRRPDRRRTIPEARA
jgi:hypothetical protein